LNLTYLDWNPYHETSIFFLNKENQHACMYSQSHNNRLTSDLHPCVGSMPATIHAGIFQGGKRQSSDGSMCNRHPLSRRCHARCQGHTLGTSCACTYAGPEYMSSPPRPNPSLNQLKELILVTGYFFTADRTDRCALRSHFESERSILCLIVTAKVKVYNAQT
jgi:hypothetical protein